MRRWAEAVAPSPAFAVKNFFNRTRLPKTVCTLRGVVVSHGDDGVAIAKLIFVRYQHVATLTQLSLGAPTDNLYFVALVDIMPIH